MKRLLAIILLITFLFIAILARLIYIGIVDGQKLYTLALDQWTRDVPITARRGSIFDRSGIVLADSYSTYTLYVRPVEITDHEKTAKTLGELTGLTEKEISKKIIKKSSEVLISKNLSKEVMLKILKSGVEGVYFSQGVQRVYPFGDFMTQIIGFTDADTNGQSGIEAKYNEYLKGKNGYVLTQTDLVGRELESNITQYIDAVPGHNAYLTLDYYIQSIVESAVRKAKEIHLAKATSAVVMDVTTGEIVAMAQSPSFDLNHIPRDDVDALFLQSKASLVTNVFEPGSTFKIISAAASLESGVVGNNYHIYCPGYHIVDGDKIKCWKTNGHGMQTFSKAVENSCNVLFTNLALNLGRERFYQYIDNFKLNKKTEIDISGEAEGLAIPVSKVKNVDIARMGFGQAIAMTPIELLTASAAVVNGGILVKPYVLDRIVSENGITVFQNYPVNVKRVISKNTSSIMREVLEGVVSHGSGKAAAVSGYRIGGKTGTAQKYKDGAIARGKYVSTFIGFAPAEDPKYITLMIVDEPTGAYYGSIVVAPYVGEIFKKIFQYMKIKAANSEKTSEFEMPDLIGMTIEDVEVCLKKYNMYYEIEGEGTIVSKQVPSAKSVVGENMIVLIECNNK